MPRRAAGSRGADARTLDNDDRQCAGTGSVGVVRDGPIAGSDCANAHCSTSPTVCWSRWWGSRCCSSGWRRSCIPAPGGPSSSWPGHPGHRVLLGPTHPDLHPGLLRHRYGLVAPSSRPGFQALGAVLTAAVVVSTLWFFGAIDWLAAPGGPGTSDAAQSTRASAPDRAIPGGRVGARSGRLDNIVATRRPAADPQPPPPRKRCR